MKTVGIICEYNPFHNGHKYHIEQAKSACGADSVVCVMSGSFVQRGEPSVFDKWSRAKMALEGGADLVIELPLVYSCQPAEIFAFGAIKLLHIMGIIDYICFGSESADMDILIGSAKLMNDEPEDFKILIKQNLSFGVSYPKAVSQALNQYINHLDKGIKDNVLHLPNNILGIEYIRSLINIGSNIKPVTIKRIGSNYNDQDINNEVASATAVRAELQKNGLTEIIGHIVPDSTYNIIKKLVTMNNNPIFFENFSDILLYKLRTMDIEEMPQYLNIKEGLEYRLKKSADSSTSIEKLIQAIKTKRYTRTSIQRLLCHIILGIKEKDIMMFKSVFAPVYIRVLGFNDKGKILLKNIKRLSKYPIITKAADFKSDNDVLNKMFSYDILSTDVYNLGHKNDRYKYAKQDYFTSPIY